MNDLLGLNLSGRDAGPSDRQIAIAAGFAGGAASLVLGTLLWMCFGTPLVPLNVADAVFAVLPGPVVEFGVAFLGPYAKRFAFAGCIGGYLVVLASCGRLFAARCGRPTQPRGMAFGAAVWLAASVTAIPLAGGGPFGALWRPGAVRSAAALLATALVYGAVTSASLLAMRRSPRLAERGTAIASRRTFFGAFVAAGVAVVVVEGIRSVADALGWGRTDRIAGGSGVFPDIDGLSREVTPAADFYTVSKNVFDPEAPPDWQLEIAGLVDRPLVLSMADLQAMPAAECFATLACIDNQVGGSLIGNGYWRGVPLAELLREAGAGVQAVDVVFTALDGYTDSIAMARALAPGCLLAYEMNGAALTAAHGAPLRAIVPGIFGMKNVKWISRIDVSPVDVRGYWQRRGWDDTAEYQTMARIDVISHARAGDPVSIAGVAFAGDRGIAAVDVSVDGGRTWLPADVRPALGPSAWSLWHVRWTPERAGRFEIVARAVDGLGVEQPERRTPAFPRGTTGRHTRSVDVSA